MIRPARETDCISLAALAVNVWLNTYSRAGITAESARYAVQTFSEDYFKSLIGDDRFDILTFVDGEYLHGFVLVDHEAVWNNNPKLGFEIKHLYVQGSHQGQGIGRQLLDEVQQRFGSRFWLYTWVENDSVTFYERYGMVEVGLYQFEFADQVISNQVFVHVGDRQQQPCSGL
jgi:ribosomal protein S18 acetylase RimI-like enzyme